MTATSDARLRLELLSDWHVGIGAGIPGSTDRLVRKDEHGIPYIPAKTVTGVWRDACERVADVLDGRTAPAAPPCGETAGPDPKSAAPATANWEAWVGWLFGGSPKRGGGGARPARLRVGPARLSDGLRAVLAEQPELRDAATFVKPGVALDPHTGAAAEDMLRMEEMVRLGAVLTSPVELSDGRLTDGQGIAAWTLLVLGARMLTGVGAKRRRGAGRCRAELRGSEVMTLTEAVATARGVPPQPPVSSSAAAPRTAAATDTTSSDWVEIPLILTTLSPLVVHDRTVSNTIRSRDAVPGTLLLPHVLARLGAATDVDVSAAARAGAIVVTWATPAIGESRGLRAPRTLLVSKSRLRDKNLTASTTPDDVDLPRPRRPLAQRYVDGSRGPVLTAATTQSATYIHNVIDDEVQRPSTAGVYSYQAIAAGSVLMAAVRLPRALLDQLGPAAADPLSGTYRLGRSSKDDYGAVEVAAGPLGPVSVPPPRNSSGNGRVRLWCLTDLLVLDENLRWSSDPVVVAGLLSDALQVRLHPADPAAHVTSRRTESWQARWQRPRPTLVGLEAGSVLAFEVTGTLDPALVARLQAAGLGERTAEGYGEVLLDADVLTAERVKIITDSPDRAGPPQGVLQPEDRPFLAACQQAAVRSAIERRSAHRAATSRATVLGAAYRIVPASQWGALRAQLPHVRDSGGLAGLNEWLQHLREVPNRVEKWRGSGPDADSVLAALNSLFGTAGRVWELLGLADLTPLLAPGEDVTARRQELTPFAVATLLSLSIAAVLDEQANSAGAGTPGSAEAAGRRGA